MALDIYTGPFTRYFSGLWENELQQMMSKAGKEYRIIKPTIEYDTDESLDPIEVSKMTENWLNYLEKSIGATLVLNEGISVSYFTSRFSEYADLYRASCYALYPRIDLAALTEDSEFEKNVEKESEFLFFRDVEVWLPANLPGSQIFEVPFPNDTQKIVSSTNNLVEELDNVAVRILNKSLSELEQSYPSLNEEELYWIDSTGLLKFYKHAQFSLENNVPIILDY